MYSNDKNAHGANGLVPTLQARGLGTRMGSSRRGLRGKRMIKSSGIPEPGAAMPPPPAHHAAVSEPNVAGRKIAPTPLASATSAPLSKHQQQEMADRQTKQRAMGRSVLGNNSAAPGAMSTPGAHHGHDNHNNYGAQNQQQLTDRQIKQRAMGGRSTGMPGAQSVLSTPGAQSVMSTPGAHHGHDNNNTYGSNNQQQLTDRQIKMRASGRGGGGASQPGAQSVMSSPGAHSSSAPGAHHAQDYSSSSNNQQLTDRQIKMRASGRGGASQPGAQSVQSTPGAHYDNNNSHHYAPVQAADSKLRSQQEIDRQIKMRAAGGRMSSSQPNAVDLLKKPAPSTQRAQSKGSNYVLRSIKRGTPEWNEMLEPFVSDLAYQSVVSKRGKISFRPHHCQAALLFVDLSGYSKITSALAYAGAHTISDCVNSYLARLVRVLRAHGGDVVKFAGDALMVVWAGDASQLEVNVYCAARAALTLQKECGVHPVPGTEHSFKIHQGLTSGTLDSEVFCAPGTSSQMPRLYHVISGETVQEIGDLVDAAASGELCVSQNCVLFLERAGLYNEISPEKLDELGGPDNPDLAGAKLLVDLFVEPDIIDYMNEHISETKSQMKSLRQSSKASSIAEDFIHSSVLDALQHGGLSPTQIAQMRELCVLFIAMTSTGDAVNWLVEVKEILDRCRCPIVQIIDDDKGVHIVAAINLYEASPETPLLGLKVCRELANKRVGAAVGMAIGNSFCGVTGSVEACRWDITGPAVVRAARLMQFAMKHHIDFAIDQTVYADPSATTYMTLVDSGVQIKGSRDPCSVYTISETDQHAASSIMESDHIAIHESHMQDIYKFLESRTRSAIVVTGAPLVGKKMVCQRAAGKCGLVPYLHLCDKSDEFASLARTIATRFRFVGDQKVRHLAENVLEDMNNSRWTCAHGQCIDLVDLVLQRGFRTCFIIDRVQYLDEFSLSIIRECLQTQKKSGQGVRTSVTSMLEGKSDAPTGKLCFLCVHVPLYGSKSANEIAEGITRSMSSLYLPIIQIGQASWEDLHALCLHVCDTEAEERLIDCYGESSGFAAGYFVERLRGVLNVGGESLVETNTHFKLQVPEGMIKITKELSVTQICPQIATRYFQIYDDLPLICQLILKIVAVATKDCPIFLIQGIIQQVIKSMIAQGIEPTELDEFINELVEIRILQATEIRDGDGRVVDRGISIQIPALGDIAMEVCTPAQLETIAEALLAQLKDSWTENFQTALVCAGLHDLVSGDTELMQQMWRQAYFSSLCECEGWSEEQLCKWKEVIRDCIQTTGFSAAEVVGDDLSIPIPTRMAIPPLIARLKEATPPLSVGPMGTTFSVICRNIVQEMGKFNGMSANTCRQVNADVESASMRYMTQVNILEDFLEQEGLGYQHGRLLESEFEMLSFFCSPASSAEEVEAKAKMVLDKMVPINLGLRRERLRELVQKFRENRTIPPPLLNAPIALQHAYEALQMTKNRDDATQDALMLLATSNWRPQPTPEFLPVVHHTRQSIPNLRDRTLKEVAHKENQQSVDDLEAFLIVTALLYEPDGNEM